ncbi:hypothetical protein ACFQXA_28345 [Nocardiopsis composta]
MAHRHPSRLNAEHVTHPSARRLLKAELANCTECRASGDAEALRHPDVLDSLLRGFVLKRAAQWRDRHSRYPTALYDLAPPPNCGCCPPPPAKRPGCASSAPAPATGSTPPPPSTSWRR